MIAPARSRARTLGLFMGVVSLGACGGGTSSSSSTPEPLPPLVFVEGCQPLLAETTKEERSPQSLCFLPYPSSYPTKAIPRAKNGQPVDLQPGQKAPFFGSTAPVIIGTLRGDIVDEGLPKITDDWSFSTSGQSRTFIMGEGNPGSLYIPHYTELVDTGDPLHKAIVLHPLRPLKSSSGYIVGFRGIRLRSGELAPMPEGFRRLRLGLGRCPGRCDRPYDTSLPDEAWSWYFRVLSDVLASMGDVQLVWHFETAAADNLSDLRFATDQDSRPAVVVSGVEDRGPAGPKIVRGTIAGRLYLESAQPIARLRQPPPAAASTITIPFTVVIPRSVLTSGQPGRTVLFGHQMFGSRAEVESAEIVAIAEQLQAVMFAIDFFGTTKDDAAALRSALAEEPARIVAVSDVMVQALSNWAALARAMVSSLYQQAELMQNGTPVYDAAFYSYLGTGHFLDGTVAFGARIRRLALSGGALNFSRSLFRTTTLDPIKQPLLDAFSEPLLGLTQLAMTQRTFDRFDPAARGVFAGADSGAPAQDRTMRTLLQVAIGDTEVSNEGSVFAAEIIQARQTKPSAGSYPFLYSTIGNEIVDGITFFDFGKRIPATPGPPSPNGVHQQLRTNKAAIRQLEAFLKPNGVVIQPCDGPCDPE